MWKKYLNPLAYVRFMKRVFLRLEIKILLQKRKFQRVMQNGIEFSHETGLYAEHFLKVRMKAPEGYTIAFTTNGTTPSGKDASSKSELEVTLDRNMSGYLVDHRDLILCSEFERSVLYQDDSLPAGIVLNTALVDSKGMVSDRVKTEVYFLEADFAKRFPDCLIVSLITDPRDLLDYKTGIYASGAVYDAWKKTETGKMVIAENKWWCAMTNSTQRGKIWERPCQI